MAIRILITLNDKKAELGEGRILNCNDLIHQTEESIYKLIGELKVFLQDKNQPLKSFNSDYGLTFTWMK